MTVRCLIHCLQLWLGLPLRKEKGESFIPVKFVAVDFIRLSTVLFTVAFKIRNPFSVWGKHLCHLEAVKETRVTFRMWDYLKSKPFPLRQPKGVSNVCGKTWNTRSKNQGCPSDLFLIHIGLLCHNTLRLIHFSSYRLLRSKLKQGPVKECRSMVWLFFFLPRPSTGSSHVEMEWSRRPSYQTGRLQSGDQRQIIQWGRLEQGHRLSQRRDELVFHFRGVCLTGIFCALLATLKESITVRYMLQTGRTELNNSRSFCPLNYLR